jgi:flagellar hook-basal body complex protein FliE
MSDFTIYNNIPRIMPSPSGMKPPATKPDAGDSFGGLLKDAITQVSDLEKGSQGELQKFMNNESDLHSVMIALEKADLSFQVMMQVRNKIVSAYQEIMRTQV